MIKEAILQDKAEIERIVAQDFIERENLAKYHSDLESPLIKAIMGPRRAGKSVFSLMLLKGRDFAYVNFDDENILKIKNYDELLKAIFSVYHDAKYLFFDEIQNLDKWELFVNKLHRRGYNLILTGSNANLLSKELATSLTGRYIPIEVFPFSFKEYLSARGFLYKDILLPEEKGKLIGHLESYLLYGGYPEPVTKLLDVKPYLTTLFEAILFKDIVKRYKVRFAQDLYNLAIYLISNFCSEYSLNSLKRALSFRSVRTVQKFLGYLEECYLFFSLNRFDYKLKEQLRSPRKIYVTDNGLVHAVAFGIVPNLGKFMENTVFQWALRKGHRPNRELFYYKTKNKKEIDFVIRRGINIDSLIQVCYAMGESKTREREMSALYEASEELKCDNLMIVTLDTEGTEIYAGKKFEVKPLWKLLLE
ncbi:MAG: ATP-binding protein [Pseudomonadota bacterium]